MPISPQEYEIRKAGTGAGMIATAAVWAAAFGAPVQRQMAALSNGGAPSQMAQMVAGGAALFLITGVILFLTGASRSRGARDARVAFKAILWGAAAGAFLCVEAPLATHSLFSFVLATICVWTLASAGTRLYLALRGMPVPQLPNPEELDLPVSGPASRDQAIEAMLGKGDWKPPRFRH